MTRSGPAIAAAPDGSGVYAVVATYDSAVSTSEVLVSSSHDQGLTWDAPVSLVRSSQIVYFQPQVAVEGYGSAGVSLLTLAAGRVDVLLVVAQPGRPGFGPPQRVTSQPFDPSLADDQGGTYWLGNYQGLAATPGAFHPTWTATRTGRPEIFTAALRSDGRTV